MKLIIIGHLLLILFSSIFGDENNVQWNEEETSTTINPLVRHYQPATKNYVVRPRHFQYKTHFGIIIKKGTTFTLKITTTGTIQELYFHCLTSKKGTFNNELNLENYTNSEQQVTTLDDCVPMTSVSHNIPLKLTIVTKNWSQLPIFTTERLTSMSAKNAEGEFYKKVQIYGFVENYYTQMLLSKKDIEILKEKNYSLYYGLQNQADLIQYYDYLLGVSRYANVDENLGYSQMERTTMFLRTEPCEEDDGKQHLPASTHDICEKLKKNCYSGCAYYAYYSEHWVAIVSDVSEFLNPSKGEDWVLLHEVGHNYNIAPYNVDIVGFGETGEVWNNIYGAMYQQKYSVKIPWINESIAEGRDTITNYKKGKPLKNWDWRPKLHFFMSIFGYDGTDSGLREFHLRHYQHSERRHEHFNNILPDILEVFLDLYDVNLLPYVEKVVDFDPRGMPMVTEDLKLRLISGRAIMPAIDFGIEAKDLQVASKERDFRYSTPLILLRKVPKKSIWVKFSINSPILLTGVCLYLNNNCHRILGHNFTLQLNADVYSTYIFLNDHENFYLSDIEYHTIANKNTNIKLNVQQVTNKEQNIYLPLVHFTISAFDINGILMSQAFINYKTMEISISQLPPANDDEAKKIFQFESQDDAANFEIIESSSYKFQVNDTIVMNVENVKRIDINGKSIVIDGKNESYLKFIFTNVGIRNKYDTNDFGFIQNEVERIRQFVDAYKIDLSGNELCREYLDRYAKQLQKFNSNIKFPNEWLN